MSAHRQVAFLRLLASTPRRDVWRFQRWDSGHSKAVEAEHVVLFNSAACQTHWRITAASCGAEKKQALPPLALPFQQQILSIISIHPSIHPGRRSSNIVLFRSHQRLSCSILQDLDTSPPPDNDPLPFEPRAFQRCRPEYAAICYDPARRPAPISADEASLLLDKVSVLRGSSRHQDVLGILGELGRLPPEKLFLVQDHPCFSTLLRYVVDSLRRFSDAQLLEVLQALVSLGLSPGHGMMGPLEVELGRRADAMDPRQLLMVADLWRCLRRVVPKFLERLYRSAEGWRWSNLGPAELVQLVYVMGEGRTSTPNLLLVLGPQVLRHLKQLTPEEVGVLCLGLFKSQSSLSLHDVTQLVGRACTLLPQMSDYGLINVLKLLRFSHLDHQRFLKAIGKEVPKRAPHMGVQGLMHVALACSALHFRGDGLLRALAHRLPDLALQCRSKDAAKLLWAFGTVGFPSSQAPRLYPSLEEAMRERADEFRRYPEHLLTGLLGLAFVGIFPRDLLMLALSPEFVELAVSSPHLELKKDLFTVDATVGLEVPDWAGPRVREGLVQEVTAQLWSFVQKDVCVRPAVLEAEALLQSLLGGARFVRKHMILPHTRSIDLEVHLDASGVPIPLCSEDNLRGPKAESATKRSHLAITGDLLAQLTKITVDPPTKQPDSPPAHSTPPTITSNEPFPSEVILGSPLPQPTEGVQRLAVQVSNRNQFCYRSNCLLGLHTLKRRQLALLGYRVVELYYWEWFRLLKRSRSERLTYLRAKIFEDLD